MSLVLVASAAKTASGNSGTLARDYGNARAATFYLSITADESTAADTLNVYIQSSFDSGTTWQDFVSFTQAVGDTGNAGFVEQMSWVRETNDNEQQTVKDGALTHGNVENGPCGSLWRVKWVIVDDSASASFTLSVRARVMVR